jgi:hypothetical protein
MMKYYFYQNGDLMSLICYQNHDLNIHQLYLLILDDLIGNNECFKKGNCTISNLTIKHRHLGINIIYTSQNPKSIPNIIRNNVDIFCLYKFANTKMVLEKLYDEVSSFLKEDEFESVYKHATSRTT